MCIATGLARTRIFALAMWGFLLTIALGSVYAVWLGTSFFPALKQAELEFGSVLANDSVAAYPAFAGHVVDTWQERLAAYPADAAGLLRTVLFALAGFLIYRLLRRKIVGSDLDDEMRDRPHQIDLLRKVRQLSYYDGRLMRRIGRGDSAGTRNSVYLGRGPCDLLDRPFQSKVAERVAFTVVHERKHVASADNALWALGAIDAVLVAGLSAALVVHPILYAVVIAIPDEAARALPYGVTTSLAVMGAVVGMAAVGSLSAGLLAVLTAAREYFADAAAAEIVGAAYLPYRQTDLPGRVGGIAEAWRLGVAPPDRCLHVQNLFPRTGALAAFGIGVWMLVRTGLAIVSGLHYGFAAAAFDAVAALGLGTMLWALPRRSPSARSYDALPWAATLSVFVTIAASLTLIDAFATRFGLAPLFGFRAMLVIVAPVGAAVFAFWIWSRCDPRRTPDVGGIDALKPRRGIAAPMLFLAASPAWAVSYIVGGLCLFTVSGTAADLLNRVQVAGWTRLIDFATSLGCCALFYLLAVNIKRPSRASMIVEATLSIPIAAAAFYLSMSIYGTLAERGASADGDALLRRLLTPTGETLPSLALSAGFAAALSMSWWARARLRRMQTKLESEL